MKLGYVEKDKKNIEMLKIKNMSFCRHEIEFVINTIMKMINKYKYCVIALHKYDDDYLYKVLDCINENYSECKEKIIIVFINKDFSENSNFDYKICSFDDNVNLFNNNIIPIYITNRNDKIINLINEFSRKNNQNIGFLI